MKHFFRDTDLGITFIGNNEREALSTLQNDYGLDLEEILDLAIDGYIVEAKSMVEASQLIGGRK